MTNFHIKQYQTFQITDSKYYFFPYKSNFYFNLKTKIKKKKKLHFPFRIEKISKEF